MFPYVLYDKDTDEYSRDVAGCTFGSLSKLTHTEPKELVEKIVKDFKEISIESLTKNPVKVATTTTGIVRNNFDEETLNCISTSWPPQIKAQSNVAKDIFYMFVKTLKAVEDKEKLFKWIIYSIFSRKWVSRKDKDIIALARGSLVTDEQSKCWVFIQNNKHFFVFLENSGEFQPATKGAIDSISVSYENKSISLQKQGEEMFSFVPDDIKQLNIWRDIFEEDVQIVNFLENRGLLHFPRPLYDTVIHNITVSDSSMLRCLLSAPIFSYDVMESLLDIFINEDKVNLLFSTIVICDLEKCNSSLSYLGTKQSLTCQMMSILVSRYAPQYYNNFVSKLVSYIDSHGEIDLTSSDESELQHAKVVFFSVIKYIFGSCDFFPLEISHFLSYVRFYSSIVRNEKVPIFNLISKLFFEYILIPLTDTHSHPIENRDSVNEFIETVYAVFNHEPIALRNHLLIDWEKRIDLKVYPNVGFFLASISDYRGKGTQFKKPEKSKMKKSCELIIQRISNDYEIFRSQVESFEKDRTCHGSPLSWNFALSLTMMFPHAADENQLEINAERMIEQFKSQQSSSSSDTPFYEEKKAQSLETALNKKRTAFVPSIADLLPPLGAAASKINVPEGGLQPTLIPPLYDDEFVAHKVLPVLPNERLSVHRRRYTSNDMPSPLVLSILAQPEESESKPKGRIQYSKSSVVIDGSSLQSLTKSPKRKVAKATKKKEVLNKEEEDEPKHKSKKRLKKKVKSKKKEHGEEEEEKPTKVTKKPKKKENGEEEDKPVKVSKKSKKKEKAEIDVICAQ